MPSPNSSPVKPFGCATPYAEPIWYSRDKSPYYNDSHRKLRAAVRKYVDEELIPYAFEWEQAGQVPEKAMLELSKCPSQDHMLTEYRSENAIQSWVTLLSLPV